MSPCSSRFGRGGGYEFFPESFCLREGGPVSPQELLKKSPPAMTPFEHLYGGYVYGILFSAILLGVITVQSRSYFLRYPSDPITTKLLVLVLILAQLVDLGCSLSGQYKIAMHEHTPGTNSWYISAFDVTSVCHILGSRPHYLTQCAQVVSSLSVQSFFSWRISKMTNLWVALPAILISLLQFAFGLWVYLLGILHLKVYSLPHWSRTSTIGLCASQAAADTLIAVIMIVLLRRKRTGFPRTDRAIKILVRYAVQTGAITSVVALTILVSFLWYDGYHFLTICFAVPFGGVYTITLLANLHSRSQARKFLLPGSTEDAGQSIHLSKMSIKGWAPRHANPINIPKSSERTFGFLFVRRQDANSV
ncbi:uncharacterized protein EI90DRAFT_3151868 [Cantharellus anzutake]|uniref:uncharacterized protein n=1 Tax=Cantharellus anzutake TaxID=1750568 RepID=UPI001902E19C|nr:uncharacterized protein EI90DRAFT_3151868 [Cantharellus anzutake]KAF8338060.1 hypothetical protein EI90DRAFT_3151868 [Cantharellus anzutake]